MLERARTMCIVRVSLSKVNMVSDITILAVYARSYRNIIFGNNEYSKRILILRCTYLSCEPRHKYPLVENLHRPRCFRRIEWV